MNDACPWDGLGLSPSNYDFCEANVCGWIVEPANTWSCLAYVAWGGYILYRARRDAGARHLWPLGLSGILIGLLSGVYHSSRAFETEFLDLFSMYTFIAYVLVVTIYRKFGTSVARLKAGYALLIGGSLALLLWIKIIGVFLFGFMIVATLALEREIYKEQKSLGDGDRIDYTEYRRVLALFALSLAFWVPDTTRLICFPDNHILQGHAAWHVTNSCCLIFMYRFLRQFEFGGGARRPMFLRRAAYLNRRPQLGA